MTENRGEEKRFEVCRVSIEDHSLSTCRFQTKRAFTGSGFPFRQAFRVLQESPVCTSDSSNIFQIQLINDQGWAYEHTWIQQTNLGRMRVSQINHTEVGTHADCVGKDSTLMETSSSLSPCSRQLRSSRVAVGEESDGCTDYLGRDCEVGFEFLIRGRKGQGKWIFQ